MDLSSTTVWRRANGRPRACDPCRRQKLACNHSLPCARCLKKGQGTLCVFSGPGAAPAKRVPQHSFTNGATSSAHLSRRPQLSAIRSVQRPRPDSCGYLGLTSFNSVFEETRNSLALLGAYSSYASNDQHIAAQNILQPGPSTIMELCLFVLRNVPGPKAGRNAFSAAPRSFLKGWVERAAKAVLQGLYDSWGAYLSNERNDEMLEEMARTLCGNTAKDLVETRVSADLWMQQFTGSNLRWDSLGLLFSVWGEGTFDDDVERDLNELMGICIRICREFIQRPTVWLQWIHQQRTVTESLCSGDASLATWRYHAETISLLTFRGLHAETFAAPNQVNMPSECERRVFWGIYAMDKVLVSFTGRPPLLSRRNISTPLPLDLSDEDLFADTEVLAHASATKLDNRGWNKSNSFLPMTAGRARIMIALLMDEIFEVAFSHNTTSITSVENLLRLRARIISLYDEEFPQSLLFRPQEITDDNVDSRIVWLKLLIKLEQLQCLFCVDRLLLKHKHQEGTELLDISFEMVSLVTGAWTRMDRFENNVRENFEWMVLGYGAAAGGILCQELLKPSYTDLATHSHVNRSDITQKLSLLVGFLDWVKLSGPNGRLCEKVKCTIQQVLDHVLNAMSYPSIPLDTFDWDIGAQFDINFDLLDTFGWFRSGLS